MSNAIVTFYVQQDDGYGQWRSTGYSATSLPRAREIVAALKVLDAHRNFRILMETTEVIPD